MSSEIEQTDDLEVVDEAEESDEASPFRYQITAYGADYPVDALVKRIASKDIVVPRFDPETPAEGIRGFQRQFVWNKGQSDRFIESLLLGLPVPGIFLVSQEDGRLLVLDGQQRLLTLYSFCSGDTQARKHKLERVQDSFAGKTYQTLDLADRRRLDDSIIHATIVRQDEPSDDQSSIYMIFERLNTGGTALQPQEIRVALYGGPFMNLLRDLNEFTAWRDFFGTKSTRLKDQELILRFFSLLYREQDYKPPMKDFLNLYASENRKLNIQNESELREIFESTVKALRQSLGNRAFRLANPLNVAVMEAVMVGVAARIREHGLITDLSGINQAYRNLLLNSAFLDSVTSGTTQEGNVKTRLSLAKTAMKELV